MSISKHTPGPWTLDDRGYKYIVSKSGNGYITRDICRLDGSTMAALAQEANARLIAAAPELLEALEELLRYHENDIRIDYEGTRFYKERLDELKPFHALIAKAKGEAV